MSSKARTVGLAVAVVTFAAMTAACNSKADTVSSNLSKDADNFSVSRQIVFYNGITGEYVAEVNGRCSLGNHDSAHELSVVCEVSKGKYIKDYLGLSDNVTYFVLQTKPLASDPYHYEINLRPSTVVPNVNVR
jgi:hypothetical protein